MLSFTVDDENWDDDLGWYDQEEVPMLDMKSVLNSDRVLLLDTGELRGESTEVFSVLFLSHLWTAAQAIWTPDDDDYIANMIIEESANIARNEIVYKELLPQGREFNISLGLIMQFTEQVLGEDEFANRRAYREILNNVNTKIIGNIATDDLLAESLFHEDLDVDEIKDRISGLRRGEWVVQLPSTGFNKQKPEILTLKPLPIPPGHSAGTFNVSARTEEVRERTRNLHCVNREHESIDNTSGVTMDSEDDIDDPEDELDQDYDALGDEHKTFLDMVFKALTDGVNNYTLGQTMNDLPYSHTANDLVDMELLEKETLGNRQAYYKPTEEAEILREKDLSPAGGGEKGNESLVHRIGVRLIATHYEQLGYDVEMYYKPPNRSALVDVYAAPTAESPGDRPKVIEVEASPEKKGHVLEDYNTLAGIYGDAVWVVPDMGGAKSLVSHFSDVLDETPSTRSDNFEKISEQLDAEGASEIIGINNLREEVRENN